MEPNDIFPDEVSFTYKLNEEENEIAKGVLAAPKDVKGLLLVFVFDNFTIQSKGKLSFKLTFYKEGKIIKVLIPEWDIVVDSKVID